MLEFKIVKIKKAEDVNVIIGQSHFIKTVEDVYELLVTTAPGAKFGLAFCESSGKCLIRHIGNDPDLEKLCIDNAKDIAAGHSFIIALKNAFPINVLNGIKNIQEVCNIYCATANLVELIIAETKSGRGILGVIDGEKPKGVEEGEDINWRKDFLRKIGYKL